MKFAAPVVLFLAVASCNKAADKRTGVIAALLAIDDAAAIVAYRSNSAFPNWLSRVDAQNHVVWRIDLPSALLHGGTGPLSLNDGVVIVRLAVSDGLTRVESGAIGIDASTGRQLWTKKLTDYVPSDPSPLHRVGLPSWVSEIALNQRVTMFSEAGTSIIATTIEARTGAVTRTREYTPNEHLRSPWVYGSSYVLESDRGAELVDAAGTSTTIKVVGAGCRIDDDYMTVVRRDHVSKVTLVLLSTKTQFSSRVVADPFDALGETPARLEACGRYKDRLVFLLSTNSFTDEPTHVITTDASGKLLASILLDSKFLNLDPRYSYPERAILSGDALPRFVPVPDGDTIAMLDLDAGKLLWRSRVDSERHTRAVMRVGSRWLFLGHYGDVVVFDGNTGQLVDAFVGDGQKTSDTIDPAHVAGDTLWTYRRNDAAPDGYEIIALPLSRPQHPAIRHFTDDLRVRWGL